MKTVQRFSFQKKINSNKTLDFGEKSILQEIISYIENDKLFFASDESLAQEWGVSTRKIQRILKKLKDLGLITSDVQRKPHIQDGTQWYNKRYLSVDFNHLGNFLDGNVTTLQEIEEIVEVPTTEINLRVTVETKEPIIFPAQVEEEGEDLYPDDLFTKVDKKSKNLDNTDETKIMVNELRDLIFTGRMTQDDLSEARSRVCEPEKYEINEFKQYHSTVLARYKKSFA